MAAKIQSKLLKYEEIEALGFGSDQAAWLCAGAVARSAGSDMAHAEHPEEDLELVRTWQGQQNWRQILFSEGKDKQTTASATRQKDAHDAEQQALPNCPL